ncbi:MAG: hypothetical protein Fur0018_13560 [Anaerolineales bacterium]
MNRKREWLFAVPLLLALAFLTGALWSAQPAAAETAQALGGMVNGVVTSPDGFPLSAGTHVKLFAPGSETLLGQALPDLNTGAFSLGPVPNGLYVIKAVPPAASGLTQSLPHLLAVHNAPVDAGDLALTRPQVFGTIYAPDGSTLAAAAVTVSLPDGRPFQVTEAPTGTFALGGLPAGTYGIQAFPLGSQPYFCSIPQAFTVSSTLTQSISITLRDADLWGVTEDPLGNPVAGARVVIANRSGHALTSLSRTDGFWTLGGLPADDYWLTALPPYTQGSLLSPHPLSITLPTTSSPFTLTFRTPPKVVSGTVQAQNGTPIENAAVVAHRVDRAGEVPTLTAADGSYSMHLTAGLWALSVHPTDSSNPPHWVYAGSSQFVHFHDTARPETQQVDFEVLLADSSAYGVVQMPDGSAPTFTVTVGLHNNEGVGRSTLVDPASGAFTLTLPSGGYKVFVHPADPNYLAPALDPVRLPPNDALDLGTITLLPRDALITGTLTVSGSGAAVEGVPLVAWRPGVPGSVHTLSGSGGLYALAVTSGAWQVRPAPLASQPYLFSGEAAEVTLAAGETHPNVDFALTGTDAVISGVLVDERGDPVTDAEGWATAVMAGNPATHNGAPIQEGAFSINVPAGDYHVAAYLPAGSPYLSTGERLVSVASGETAAITLTVRTKDAVIGGALVDPRAAGQPVSGLPALVAAWSEGNWAAAPVNTDNGTFALDVAAGLWHLNYRLGSAQYARLGGGQNVPVESGQTVLVGLPVTQKDARLEGQVLDPDGNPLAGAQVIVHGFEGTVDGLWLHTTSHMDGSFSLALPYGRYRLAAVLPGSHWLKPVEVVVNVAPGAVSGGHVLQFRRSDATLSGALTVTPTLGQGTAYVFAWSDDGAFVHGRFPVTQAAAGGSAEGAYSLPVISGATWHVGAAFETSLSYWAARQDVFVASASQSLDLVLTGPHPKPAPVVARFDASTPQRIALSDGTEIYIPGGALPVSGTVTLRVVPIATLPGQHSARVVRYGYAFLATGPDGEPIEAHFNQDVVIRFAYDEADLDGFPEGRLRPAYFSTTTNEWTYPESYVVDTVNNTVTMQIDHFTDFALTTNGMTYLYLPMLTR